MTKRAFGKFTRRKQDAYDSPESVLVSLRPHLMAGAHFLEPCAGKGDLWVALEQHGLKCVGATDIEPRGGGVVQGDALDLREVDFRRAYRSVDYIITNPPWTRGILHPMIDHLSAMRPTWLLFDANWMHTKQAAPFMGKLVKIVSVGRVSWMGNGVSGFDDCAWHLFDARHEGATQFVGRAA